MHCSHPRTPGPQPLWSTRPVPLATSLPWVHSRHREHRPSNSQSEAAPSSHPTPANGPASFPHQGLATSLHSVTTSRLWVSATGSAFSRELEPTASASPRPAPPRARSPRLCPHRPPSHTAPQGPSETLGRKLSLRCSTHPIELPSHLRSNPHLHMSFH